MQSHIRQCIFCFLLGVVGCATEGPARGETGQSIEAACTRLVMDYALYRDQGNAAALAELFSEDAQLLMNGETFTGRSELRARATHKSDSPFLTHLMSTVQIYPESASQARGLSYVSVYVGPAGAESDKQASLAAVGEYRDQFVRTKQGWKIARREFVPRVTFP